MNVVGLLNPHLSILRCRHFRKHMTKRKTPGIRALRKHLAAKSQQELIDDIARLYEHNDVVRDFYALQIDPSYPQHLLADSKATITHEFFPERNRNHIGLARSAVVRRVLSGFAKLVSDPLLNIDLMLHAVEMGVAFTRSYGDIDGPFYRAVERVYYDAILLIHNHELDAQFLDRCEQVMRHSQNLGWGFADNMMQIFYEGLDFPGDEEADETDTEPS
ncbi:MAG: hypothetical protein HC822_22795 [Oscillochloris sp.]|nr:hypothetical protein [Oscillochloris sp.]